MGAEQTVKQQIAFIDSFLSTEWILGISTATMLRAIKKSLEKLENEEKDKMRTLPCD